MKIEANYYELNRCPVQISFFSDPSDITIKLTAAEGQDLLLALQEAIEEHAEAEEPEDKTAVLRDRWHGAKKAHGVVRVTGFYDWEISEQLENIKLWELQAGHVSDVGYKFDVDTYTINIKRL